MKRHLIWFSLLTVIAAASFSYGQEMTLSSSRYLAIQSEVLLPFFNALRNGDVSHIKKHLSNEMYERNRALFEENRDYPQFLRDFYRDVRFRVVKAKTESNSKTERMDFHVVMEFPNGHSSTAILKMRRQDDAQQGKGAVNWEIER